MEYGLTSNRKKLKTRDVVVHLRRYSCIQDDQTVTKVYAERQGALDDGDIFDMKYSLIKDNTTDRVRLTDLEIQVKSLSTNKRLTAICQLPNNTYICLTLKGLILKLDCFYSILQTNSSLKHQSTYLGFTEHQCICAIGETTVAIVNPQYLRETWVEMFSVKERIKLLRCFMVQGTSQTNTTRGFVTCIDELLYVLSMRDVLVFTKNGMLLKTVQLPFDYDGYKCVTNNGLVISYDLNHSLKITDIRGAGLICTVNHTHVLEWSDACADTNGNLFYFKRYCDVYKFTKATLHRNLSLSTVQVRLPKSNPNPLGPEGYLNMYHVIMSDMVVFVRPDNRIYIDKSDE